MDNIFERTIGLLGEDYIKLIDTKTILLIGLGGVGGTALESLIRTGFKNLIIVDFDKVSFSNLNRQILYTIKDVGISKVEAAKKRIYSINPNANIVGYDMKIDNNTINQLKKHKIDFVVDAIDDVNAKLEIAKFATEKNIPIIVSLGMANRLNPSKIDVIRLDKTTNDPLARKIRYMFKQSGLDTKKIMTICSSEKPIKDGTILNSVMMPPSAAGLNITHYILDYFMKEE